MKLNTLITLAAAALSLAGCSSTPTRVDSGTIHGRTFSFVSRGVKPSPDYADDRQAAHEMIQAAITRNLERHGLTRVAGAADITVGYLVILGNNATTEAINDYFEYGAGAAALHDKAHSRYTGSDNPNYFEAGTLLIDIVDSRTHKLLKRDYATRPVIRNISAEARAERIQEVVDEILKSARFGT